MKYVREDKNINIEAENIYIGRDVTFGNNIDIKVFGDFSIGDFSHLGSDCHIRGNDITIGKHLYNSSGLRIGGGGRLNPTANLTIGDRCTIHNNHINIAKPVTLGNDVGLSQDVDILTHGYWLSVLDGNPASFSPVVIGNGVIIGWRSLIMMGVEIIDDVVIGGQSVVTKSITKKGVYAGSPAKYIKDIAPLEYEDKVKAVKEIINNYKPIAEFHKIKPNIVLDYPTIIIDDFWFNCETFEYDGKETNVTDDFRDYIRKYGIRIYTERKFKSNI